MTFEDAHRLQDKMTDVANAVARQGKDFNHRLLGQFKEWESVGLGPLGDLVAVPREHLVMYECVAQAMGWLQQLPPQQKTEGEATEESFSLPILYLQVLLEARRGRIPEDGVEGRLTALVEEKSGGNGEPSGFRRRLFGLVAGLETWAAVDLPSVGRGGTLDLNEVQRRAISKGERARWTAYAPIKMYAIYRNLGTHTPRTICPPIGRAVARGINELLGFGLGETKKEYDLSRDLHLKLADLARASIWDINSGLYRLGGGR